VARGESDAVAIGTWAVVVEHGSGDAEAYHIVTNWETAVMDRRDHELAHLPQATLVCHLLSQRSGVRQSRIGAFAEIPSAISIGILVPTSRPWNTA
jgi:hypothetical protein